MSVYRHHLWYLGLVMVPLLSACGASSGAGSTTSTTSAKPTTYVAIGGSESIGAGSTDPLLDGWTQVFYRTALPQSTVFVNLSIPRSTTAEAITDQLPEALSLSPTIVTIWLNTTDLFSGVAPGSYGTLLYQLISRLRHAGVTEVLVANTPPLDQLPAYRSCLAGAPVDIRGFTCPNPVPSPAALDAGVAAYNSVAASDASALGAILVDLHTAGLPAEQRGTEASQVSTDGLDLSDAGHAQVARLFAAALAASSRGRGLVRP